MRATTSSTRPPPKGSASRSTDEAARLLGGKGDFAIVTGALSAANQNQWIEFIKQRMAKYPGLKLATIRPSDDDRDKAFAETQTVLKVYPDVKLIMAIATAAVAGRRRSCPAIGPQGRGRDRALAAQPEQALRA